MSALSKIRDGRKIGGDAFLSWRQEFIKAGESADGVEGAVARKLAQASTEKDIIIADGERSVKAATAVLGKAVYRDLFVMDDRDIRGAGLPYAIGAAIANPSCRVTLLCDKNSLFYHVRELQPAVSEGLDFTILCIDSEADEDNVCDTGLVLEGLGCDVAAFDPEKTSPGDLFKHRPGAPGGYICR